MMRVQTLAVTAFIGAAALYGADNPSEPLPASKAFALSASELRKDPGKEAWKNDIPLSLEFTNPATSTASTEPKKCAIPLRELKATNAAKMDPMAFGVGPDQPTPASTNRQFPRANTGMTNRR